MPNIFKNPATAAITGGITLPFGMDWLQHDDVKVPFVDSVRDMASGKFDKFRTGNFALNSMIGAASGGLLANPKTLVQGASLAALAPAKDLLMNMQGTPEKVNKVLDEVPGMSKSMQSLGTRSNIMLGILGAGALGLGGAALWKYLKKRDDIPGENGTIQYIMKGKEGDPETDALVTVPINNPAVSPSVAEDMNISVRRGLGKAVKWNSKRRDPNTGRLIPYEIWNNLYGHKDEAEPAKAPNSAYDAKSGDNDPKGMNKDAAKKRKKKDKESKHRTAGIATGSVFGALKGLATGRGLIPGALSGANAGMEVDTLRNLNASLKEKDRKNAGFISGGILGGLGGGTLGALLAPDNKAAGIPIGALLGALAGGSTGIDIDSYRASGAVADKISKKRKGKKHSNRFGGTLTGALAGAGLGGLIGSIKRDAAGNAGLGLGDGTGIGAGIGAAAGGLLGNKIDEYRNLTDADEMLGNGRDHKAPLIGAGAGGLLGAILGGLGAGPAGAIGGSLAGAGSGAMLGTGIGSYLKSNDIVDKEEEPEKNAAAEGFNAMAYNSGSGAPEGVLKAVNRFTRPVDTERKDDHSYTEGSHNIHSAGLGLNDAGGNAGINKAATVADVVYASALRAGMAKRATRELAEGAGTIGTSVAGGFAGHAAGKAIASKLGYDPGMGGAAGAAMGALAPSVLGYLTGKVAGPRSASDQALHDDHSAMAEYVIPGYASYQYARRESTEDAAAQAKEDTMKSYLATGAMPGGQDGIPSNLDMDDEEDYGNFKSAAAGAVVPQQPAYTHPAVSNLNGALRDSRELSNANRDFLNTANNPGSIDLNKARQNAAGASGTTGGAQQQGQQPLQSQREYNEQTRIATDMQMYGYARVRGADGKLYHPTQAQQQGQQQGQTVGSQVANTTLPAAGGANATSTQNPAPRSSNGNAPLTMNSTPAPAQNDNQRELESATANGQVIQSLVDGDGTSSEPRANTALGRVQQDVMNGARKAAGDSYDQRLERYRQRGYKGDGSDITGLVPRDKYIEEHAKRVADSYDPMTEDQAKRYEAMKNQYYRHSDKDNYNLAGKREKWLKEYDAETDALANSYNLGDDSTLPSGGKNLSFMEDEIRGKTPAGSGSGVWTPKGRVGYMEGYDSRADKTRNIRRHVEAMRRINMGHLAGNASDKNFIGNKNSYNGSYVDDKTRAWMADSLGLDGTKLRNGQANAGTYNSMADSIANNWRPNYRTHSYGQGGVKDGLGAIFDLNHINKLHTINTGTYNANLLSDWMRAGSNQQQGQ